MYKSLSCVNLPEATSREDVISHCDVLQYLKLSLNPVAAVRAQNGSDFEVLMLVELG